MVPMVFVWARQTEVIFACRGELDLTIHPLLRCAAHWVDLNSDSDVLVDLADVRFVDAGCVRILGQVAAGWEDSGRAVSVVPPSGFPRTVLHLTGFDDRFAVLPSCTHADPSHAERRSADRTTARTPGDRQSPRPSRGMCGCAPGGPFGRPERRYPHSMREPGIIE